jgi:hypothetical protein
MTRFITTIVDPAVEARRERLLDQIAQAAKGKRGQPPMVDRLRVLLVYVDYLLQRNECRFGTCRTSIMNRMVRDFQNKKIKRSQSTQKSRSPRKQVGPDAVSKQLKQVRRLL